MQCPDGAYEGFCLQLEVRWDDPVSNMAGMDRHGADLSVNIQSDPAMGNSQSTNHRVP